MRASARTLTEGNKRVLFDEEVNFIQDKSKRIDDMQHFKEIIRTYPWMSYRSDFKEINNYTSDSGWGWMVRVGQMMIAYTLIQIQLKSINEQPVRLQNHKH